MSEQTSAVLTWQGKLEFAVRSGSGHNLVTGSLAHPGHTAPSPMELVLAGVAGCTAIDVVAILEKMRQPLEELQVSIHGTRAATHPKYFTEIEITYDFRGRGLDREKVERAVQLSHGTYCSAVASLRPDCRITSHIELRQP